MKRLHTIVARAVVIQKGKILLTRNIDHDFYFLPGGHVEAGEFVLDALDRELREELGTGMKKAEYVGAHDNRYLDSYTGPNQELGLIFAVSLTKPPRNMESHITTEWIPLKKLTQTKIMPLGLSANISRWSKDKKAFWMVIGR